MESEERMERSHMTERILQLTLEIIYLLTGEDYGPKKKTLISHPCVRRDESRSPKPIIELSPPSLSPERNNDKKILEVTQKIIELLTGEVPIRCQDVTVYFSMEEWEYLEGHKELYKDVMMEKRPPLTSPDGSRSRNTPERCPRPLYSRDSTQEHQENPEACFLHSWGSTLEHHEIPQALPVCLRDFTQGHHEIPHVLPLYSRDSVQEHQEIPQEDQEDNLTECEIEDRKKKKHVRDEERSEEEIPSDTTGQCSSPPQGLQESQEILQDCQGENRINVKVENTRDEDDMDVRDDEQFHEEEYSAEISPGGHPNMETMKEDPLISPDCEIEVEITFDSSEEDLLTPNLHPVLQNANLSSDPSTDKSCFSDLAHPGPHQTAYTGGKAFTCNDCGRSFDKKARLIVHQRSHTGEKPYLCTECGKCFAQTSHLFRHVKVHSEQKPFLCSDCGRCFKEKAHLLRHQKIHMGIKPFVCPVCGKHFREKANLVQHDINHTGNYPHSCLQCGKCFLSKSRLDIHQMSHAGEKPYTCAECGKCFLHKSVFVRHQKIHSEVKPYTCSECGKSFKYQSHLIKHEKDHKGVKPYSCSDCGNCFSTKPALIAHQLIHM